MIKIFVIVSCVIGLGCNLQPGNRRLTITNNEVNMDWKVLREESELDEIIRKSEIKPQVIFKHSTRCSVSSVAKGRLERSQIPSNLDFYYLDLISYRSISTKVSQLFHVHHESPQVLVIKNGECVYDESHMSINMEEISVNADKQ